MAQSTESEVLVKQRKILQYPPVYAAKFKAGPYRPPDGKVLHDEYLNKDVEVEGKTDALIPWPGMSHEKGRHAGLLPILCGDLVRAVVEEDEGVVAHYWGVTLYMVNQWKQAIAGAKTSTEVHVLLQMKRLDPEFRKKFGYK